MAIIYLTNGGEAHVEEAHFKRLFARTTMGGTGEDTKAIIHAFYGDEANALVLPHVDGVSRSIVRNGLSYKEAVACLMEQFHGQKVLLRRCEEYREKNINVIPVDPMRVIVVTTQPTYVKDVLSSYGVKVPEL